ncbi:ABC transporter ATP-binding protein [Rathayibacter sp. YIM 133350]|uniref:sulfate/molybdate ABC transporter ATP-binding protein n=1 Tax=Rathayibacter sp. YIM 133350 TaxID=3131992 RepID=UPI00307E5AED
MTTDPMLSTTDPMLLEPLSTDAPGGRARATRGGALHAEVRLLRGEFDLDVEVDLAPGEVLALLGPNGAGKSTVLNVVAGLLAPDAGEVSLDGRDLTRIRPGQRMLVPPAGRGIGLLGQQPRLFPHLSALQNVAFGPRAQGASSRHAAVRAREWLARVGLEQAAQQRPAQLSGGQQQRVAIARALAASPAVLLLDEPFASLDSQTAPEVRELLRLTLRDAGTSAIIVTHDVLDAVVLADRTAVMDAGRILERGPTAAVLSAPRNPFTARFAGVNLVTGVAQEGRLRVGAAGAGGPDGVTVSGISEGLTDGEEAAAVFRPASVVVSLQRQEQTSLRNHWPAGVEALEATATGVRVRTGPLPVTADVTAATVAELGLRVGAQVWISVKAAEVSLYQVGTR